MAERKAAATAGGGSYDYKTIRVSIDLIKATEEQKWVPSQILQLSELVAKDRHISQIELCSTAIDTTACYFPTGHLHLRLMHCIGGDCKVAQGGKYLPLRSYSTEDGCLYDVAHSNQIPLQHTGLLAVIGRPALVPLTLLNMMKTASEKGADSIPSLSVSLVLKICTRSGDPRTAGAVTASTITVSDPGLSAEELRTIATDILRASAATSASASTSSIEGSTAGHSTPHGRFLAGSSVSGYAASY
jgi:hypothetical protein